MIEFGLFLMVVALILGLFVGFHLMETEHERKIARRRRERERERRRHERAREREHERWSNEQRRKFDIANGRGNN
tara:strand:- start:260 stop:484 length:225 start_codon:yes stop_codon:yes gene_type:complete